MTQSERVLAYMRENGSITQRDAVWIGIYRLSARVYDLRRDGYKVASTLETVQNKQGEKAVIARYTIAEDGNV